MDRSLLSFIFIMYQRANLTPFLRRNTPTSDLLPAIDLVFLVQGPQYAALFATPSL